MIAAARQWNDICFYHCGNKVKYFSMGFLNIKSRFKWYISNICHLAKLIRIYPSCVIYRTH